jgi:tetratricopeptide (TPR) repeat protein
MQSKIIALIPILLLLVSMCAAKDIPAMLAEANKLKYAEKYEEAEKIYNEVLKIDPKNKAALQGKDDCRVMLEPIIPMQHLMVTEIDPEYSELINHHKNASTPWDKKRAEIAYERYAVRYTGKVFGEAGKKLEKEADEIIAAAAKRVEGGEDPEKVYLETEKELTEKQRIAHRGWKGHGPQFLEKVLNKLDKIYKDNNWSNPYEPLTLSAKASPEATKEMDISELTVSIKNKSQSPVILLAFQFEGLRYITFSWQKAMHGDLSFDKEESVYRYNSLAQQETYHYFNNGLLLPSQTAVFRKSVRIPKPTSNAYVRFVVLNEESMRHVYIPSGEDIDTYVPISYEELKAAAGPDYFTEEGPFPNLGTIIFDAQDPKISIQSFILVLGEK